MNLDVYNTSIHLSPYAYGDIPIIENMYTAISKFDQKEYACGYMIENNKLYLPRGTPISKLEELSGVKANYIYNSDPYEQMQGKYISGYKPKDKLQEESIEFLLNGAQLALNLGTGKGKTFCVVYASSKLKLKTIVITPNEGIKGQWLSTCRTMFNYKESDVLNISGSGIMEDILNDNIGSYDMYLVNHQTLRSYLTNHNSYMLGKFFKKIKVGIKVYDESHMEFGNILTIDFLTNTYKTWYLTATFDRSDKSESACFKRAFASVVTFGAVESKKMTEKHVIYHVVNITSRPTQRDRFRVVPYRGMTSATYGRYAFIEDSNRTAYTAMLAILKKIDDLEGKILIFVSLIDAVDDVVQRLKMDWGHKDIGAYHSKISKDEKEDTLKKDIIVSTIKSCGTGRDIPGLRAIICIEPISSKVVTEQMFGRLRPYAEDKDTYYFDICDNAFVPITWWFKSRFKKIQELAKEIVYLNIDE